MTTTHPDLEKCHSYVVHHLSGEGQPRHTEETGMPFVTISRQAGAGGRSFGKMLQTYLDEHAPLSKGHWTLFDDNLVKQAMKEHGLHKRFAQYLPENRISELTGIIGELVGLHPPIWELYQHVYETVLHLANIGGVILVGRGAHVVTRRLRRGVHLRLISRPENRAERAAKFYDMPIAQARSFIHHEDRARRL
ncbi:MAG: cytidylate kinase family protein, partial [Verrucomicrobiae bacterium]|nr:cytidylate kinase family protein [Verrucomicrobiae bacterium]